MEQETCKAKTFRQERAVWASTRCAVVREGKRDPAPHQVFEATHQFILHHLLMISLVPSNGGTEIGGIHIEKIHRTCVCRCFQPIADAKLNLPPQDERYTKNRRAHFIWVHTETSPVYRLCKVPAFVEPDRIFHAAAYQI